MCLRFNERLLRSRGFRTTLAQPLKAEVTNSNKRDEGSVKGESSVQLEIAWPCAAAEGWKHQCLFLTAVKN